MSFFSLRLFLFAAVIQVWQSSPSPFFFLCQYHDFGGEGNTFQRGEAAVSISIQGDPDAYVPGKIYSVVVESSADFDGFMMVGLYTSSTSAVSLPMGYGPTPGSGNMCSLVHSQLMSGRPSRSLTFQWRAPPDGSGCVNFLVTASLGQELLFKDTPALQLCQEGAEGSSSSLPLHGDSSLEEDGVVLRARFREESLDPRVWDRVHGGRVSDHCGRQQALVFCQPDIPKQELVSRPMNTTEARALQFSIGSGNCSSSSWSSSSSTLPGVSLVTIQFSLDGENCSLWKDLDTVSVRPDLQTVVLQLPRQSLGPAVCFRWLCENDGCWAIVSVLVSSGDRLGSQLQEDFDPADPANILYLQGARIRRKCGSRGAALVFGQGKSGHQQWVTTRDLDLQTSTSVMDIDAIYKEDFHLESDGWQLTGVTTKLLTFTPADKEKCLEKGGEERIWDAGGPWLEIRWSGQLEEETGLLCSPYLDATRAGSLHFRFRTGSLTECRNRSVVTSVFAQVLHGKKLLLTEALEHLHKSEAALVLPRESRTSETRFCWTLQRDSWLDLDFLRLLPWTTVNDGITLSTTPLVLQFNVNLHCKTAPDHKRKIRVEFSTDWGGSWHDLHSLCLPPGCPEGARSFLSSTLTGQDSSPTGWQRWSFPLPYAASVSGARFRFKASGPFAWALDELFVGACPYGCWGRGRCVTSEKCTCDPGFSGEACELSSVAPLKDFAEPFSVLSQGHRYLKTRGAVVGYDCGILSEGKSVLLNGPGVREVLLGPVDTDSAPHLRFRIRSGGVRSICPGPDRPVEGLQLATSCDGELTWDSLWWSQHEAAHEDSHVSLSIPKILRGRNCVLRYWQPYHSGQEKDVWALDDLVVGPGATDSLTFDLGHNGSSSSWVVHEGATTVRGHCGWDGPVLLLRGPLSQVETRPLGVGPNFMLQFRTAVGCRSDGSYLHGQEVLVEYSTSSHRQQEQDHSGGEWRPVSTAGRDLADAQRKDCPDGPCQGERMSLASAGHWTRVTLPLGRHLWSPWMRLRLRPGPRFPEGGTWALRYLYLGPSCPGLCSGHGQCMDREERGRGGSDFRHCRCDAGFSGPDCSPKVTLPSRPLGRGLLSGDLEREGGFEVTGTDSDSGRSGYCVGGGTRDAPLSPLHSPMRFCQPDSRSLTTPDLDTRSCRFLQFFLDAPNRKTRSETRTAEDEEEKTGGPLLRLECSVDGGVLWKTIRDLLAPGSDEAHRPRLEHVPVPNHCRGSMGRFRLRQVSEGGLDWILNGLYLDSPDAPLAGNMSLGVLPWPLTAASQGRPSQLGRIPSEKVQQQGLCEETISSGDSIVVVVGSPDGGQTLALTRPLGLQEDHVFQFQISVGCSSQSEFGSEDEVQLEYSTNLGSNFLSVHGCSVGEASCLPFSSGQRSRQRRSFRSGRWTRVQVTWEQLASASSSESVIFLWRQRASLGGKGIRTPFALRDFYLGPPCPHNCRGHGRCDKDQGCVCDQGYSGSTCETRDSPLPSDLWDTFEGKERPPLWNLIRSGSIIGSISLPSGCGDHTAAGSQKALRFSSPIGTTAEARTVEMDSSGTSAVHFVIRVGSPSDLPGCRRPSSSDDVWLEWSTDDGVSWHNLARLRATDLTTEPRPLTLSLPDSARTVGTTFRWIQEPHPDQEAESAEWSLDNVSFRQDSSLAESFREDFLPPVGPPSSSIWYGIRKGSVDLLLQYSCKGFDGASNDHALILQGIDGSQAETWDFRLSPGSFLQFYVLLDIVGGCSDSSARRTSSDAGEGRRLRVDWSPNRGRTWTPAEERRGPPWTSDWMDGWHRVTLDLQAPVAAGHALIRFRWRLELTGERWSSQRTSGWALDNIRFLGPREACPWMCSGQGSCTDALCSCDSGFEGPRCVSNRSLLSSVSESFLSFSPGGIESWCSKSSGAETGLRCGILVSGPALVFFKNGPRLLETVDLDLSRASFLQFTLRTGCGGRGRSKRSEVDPSASSKLLLQYSNNGGITWNMIKEIPLLESGTTSFQSFPLDRDLDLHTNASRFRLWQDDTGSSYGQREWALDELVLAGPALQQALVRDSLRGVPDSRLWMSWPGGTQGQLHPCRSGTEVEEGALWFRNSEGERSITTWDLDLPSMGSFLHFQIAVGCDFEVPWDPWPVSLEWSGDGGVTWAMLVPPCTSRDITSAASHCYRREPSLYHPSGGNLWRDVLLPLDRGKLCGAVRLRWRQGSFGVQDRPPSWALTNVTIGPGPCPQDCVRGDDESVCPSPCPIPYDVQRSTTLKEDFDSLPLSPERWSRWSGADLSGTGCGRLASGPALFFRWPSERILVTAQLDTSSTTLLQFHLRLGCNPISLQEGSVSLEPVWLLFSVDGGATWTMLEEFLPRRPLEGATFLTLELPPEARTKATIFKWWQPLEAQGEGYAMDWAIDRVQLGVALYDFQSSSFEEKVEEGVQGDQGDLEDEEIYLSATSTGTPDTFICGGKDRYLHFADGAGDATTTDVPVQEGMFLQFRLAMGCTKSVLCYKVTLEMSADRGESWRPVMAPCPPWYPGCQGLHTRGSIYPSDLHSGPQRILQSLDPLASSLVRFRWRSSSSTSATNTSGHPERSFSGGQMWSLGGIAFGTLISCPSMCRDRGNCYRGRCRCDPGWSGESCSIPADPVPDTLEDNFETGGRSLPIGSTTVRWSRLVGAVTSDLCGPMPTATALHFYGGCSRLLETIDLDLRSATTVHFWIRSGCLAPARGRHAEPVGTVTPRFRDVLLQGSDDGGLTWTTFAELDAHRSIIAISMSVPLPDWLRSSGVGRLRWWQPSHNGRATDDWALDAVRIGPTRLKAEAYYGYRPSDTISRGPDELQLLQMSSDSPTEVLEEKDHWLRQENVRAGLCGDWSGLVGKATSTEEAILETFEVPVRPGSILQFEVWVGCLNLNEGMLVRDTNPLSLESSGDGGATWQPLVPLCHPWRRGCGGANTPSRFYPRSGWRREVFPLEDRESIATEEPPILRRRRFRWRQGLGESSPSWSVRAVYLGPSCPPDHCGGGNGRCTPRGCLCSDQDCRPASQILSRSLRWPELESAVGDGTTSGSPWKIFDRSLGASWGSGGKDHAMMEGPGLRLLETFDLDLRGARFIRFVVSLGGGYSLASSAEEEMETVYLQFSFNRGITWSTLSSYSPNSVKPLLREYLELPSEVLMAQVRFRWWQMLVDLPYDVHKASPWTLSSIHIGGDEVNPAWLYQNFSDPGTPLGEHFWDWSNARVSRGHCGKDGNSSALVWPASSEGATDHDREGVLVSRQLIVAESFILQFKLVVDCEGGEDSGPTGQCSSEEEGVLLEYTTDFAREPWRPVEEPCLPSSLSSPRGGGGEGSRPGAGSCSPYRFHDGTFYRARDHRRWTRITLTLQDHLHSGQTQFRLKGKGRISWALEHLYLGEACPALCSGRGDCLDGGVCHCDPGTTGTDCRTPTPSPEAVPVLEDSFEDGRVPGPLWERIRGGRLVSSLSPHVGCGPLMTSGSGRRGRLHFQGCGTREAVTRRMDTARLRKLSYALRIGSEEGITDCHVLGLSNGSSLNVLQDKGVLLQFSSDEGINWVSLASHHPHAFLQAQRVWQDLPVEARGPGVRLRWWQPRHQGQGHDQWALDEVKLHRSPYLESWQKSWQKYSSHFHD